MPTTIILVRHGQTEWNRVERFRGRIDIPLNPTGVKQAKLTAKRISKQRKPVAVFSSPLSRAMQTAEIISKKLHLSPIPQHGLIDIDYGQWQGLTPEEARDQWPKLVKNWYEHPEVDEIPGGETLSSVRNRAMSTLAEICRRYPNQEIVLVSHTVVTRLMLLAVLGLKNDHFWRIRQEPCAINVFEAQQDQFTLVSINDTCHLDDLS